MPESPSSLPARPSLEQLHKQAKELLRQHRAGDPSALERLSTADPQLADAQFALAREYGFETWAKLKQHVEGLAPAGVDVFERMARDLAAAFMAGDKAAVREINWRNGTSFAADLGPELMQRRLVTWFAAPERNPDLALADARAMVAHSYDFESWHAFTASLTQAAAGPPTAPLVFSTTPPFYQIDWAERSIAVRGPQAEKDWDTVFAVMREHRLTALHAGAITDAAMQRMPTLEHLKRLEIGGATLTDAGFEHLARQPQLEALDAGGWKSPITDRGLHALRHLPRLRTFAACWSQAIGDTGIANLAACDRLESVNLLGTPAGDGAIAALAGKRELRRLRTGRSVTDAGLALLQCNPAFATWQGGEPGYSLMSPDADPTHLLIDGPFTNQGLSALQKLDGLFGLTFFWHCTGFTSAGLAPLKDLANLGFLGCQDAHCDDEAMRHIAAIPRLRMLMGQGAVAGHAGFAALSRSPSVEYIWGRECPNLTGAGFAALAVMPSLRGLAVSCRRVDDTALSALPHFPALRELMPMDVSDEGFRHVGLCRQLTALWCMYCRDTGDAATEHIAGLPVLKSYYAGSTQITDRSLELLGGMRSLERLQFWQCAAITNAGIAQLAGLPRLRELSLEGLPGVTREAVRNFPPYVHVKYSS